MISATDSKKIFPTIHYSKCLLIAITLLGVFAKIKADDATSWNYIQRKYQLI